MTIDSLVRELRSNNLSFENEITSITDQISKLKVPRDDRCEKWRDTILDAINELLQFCINYRNHVNTKIIPQLGSLIEQLNTEGYDTQDLYNLLGKLETEVCLTSQLCLMRSLSTKIPYQWEIRDLHHNRIVTSKAYNFTKLNELLSKVEGYENTKIFM